MNSYDYDEEPDEVTVPVLEVERSRRKVRRLYGPTGKVILSVSNRPPTGFHQGQRDKP